MVLEVGKGRRACEEKSHSDKGDEEGEDLFQGWPELPGPLAGHVIVREGRIDLVVGPPWRWN